MEDFTNRPEFTGMPKGHQVTWMNYLNIPRIPMKFTESNVDKFNKQYEGLAEFKVTATVKTKKFEKNTDTTIPDIAKKIGEEKHINVNVSSFHAGAETHI